MDQLCTAIHPSAPQRATEFQAESVLGDCRGFRGPEGRDEGSVGHGERQRLFLLGGHGPDAFEGEFGFEVGVGVELMVVGEEGGEEVFAGPEADFEEALGQFLLLGSSFRALRGLTHPAHANEYPLPLPACYGFGGRWDCVRRY